MLALKRRILQSRMQTDTQLCSAINLYRESLHVSTPPVVNRTSSTVNRLEHDQLNYPFKLVLLLCLVVILVITDVQLLNVCSFEVHITDDHFTIGSHHLALACVFLSEVQTQNLL